jgi:YjbR
MDDRSEAEVQVPAGYLAELRRICRALPEAYEEKAWVGVRWRVRKRTFAHIVSIDDGWPPAYARAAGTAGPAVVLTFRSSGTELDVLRQMGAPYFAPPWRSDEVGLVLDESVDWVEIDELVTDSYCTQAPKRLVALIERPADT